MAQGSAEISDKVTVLVFKDNYAARTFQIPLSWISRFGIFLGVFAAVTTVSVFTAAKYYQIAAKTDPSRVQDLEQEITDLRANLKKAESRPSELIAASTPRAAASPILISSQGSHPKSGIPSSAPLTPSGTPFFTEFPANISNSIPDPSTLAFSIRPPKTQWRGKTLRVQFALQYTKQDQGNQQGRILILARGPETLLTYPSGVLNPTGTENLINPMNGEFFSVSRFREVKADFGPVANQKTLNEIEIYIFNKEGQILAYQKINSKNGLEASRSGASVKPIRTSTPEVDTHENLDHAPDAEPAGEPTGIPQSKNKIVPTHEAVLIDSDNEETESKNKSESPESEPNPS